MAQILLVDDDTEFLNATRELLGLLGHQVAAAQSVADVDELFARVEQAGCRLHP